MSYRENLLRKFFGLNYFVSDWFYYTSFNVFASYWDGSDSIDIHKYKEKCFNTVLCVFMWRKVPHCAYFCAGPYWLAL